MEMNKTNMIPEEDLSAVSGGTGEKLDRIIDPENNYCFYFYKCNICGNNAISHTKGCPLYGKICRCADCGNMITRLSADGVPQYSCSQGQKPYNGLPY